MWKFRINRIKALLATGTALVILGVVGAAPTIYYHLLQHGTAVYHGIPTVSAANVKNSEPTISGHPTSISIPSLNINLPIIDGYYDKNSGGWTLTLNKAQFATLSAAPNNKQGNTLIYGHYRPEVFAYLHLMKPGAKVAISTDNGYVFTYRYTSTYAVPPNDTSIFNYQGPPMLTVQTCSGAWFQNRQMYQFTYLGYHKA